MILVMDRNTPGEALLDIRGVLEGGGWNLTVSTAEEQIVLVLTGEGNPEVFATLFSMDLPGMDLIPIESSRRYRRTRGRLKFLNWLVYGLALLVAVGIVLPILGFLKPPAVPLFDPSLVQAALVEQLPPNSSKLIRFRELPVMVVRNQGGRFFALSATCTHMNACQLQWDTELGRLICPCHGDVFDLYGNVVRGPSSVPLPTYPVEVIRDKVFIRRGG